MTSVIVYEDAYGEIVNRPADNLAEIRWYDATAEIDADTFNAWMSSFAGEVEKAGHTGILVDAISFNMTMADMDWEYRNTRVVPRYNAAGVTKFAFLMPAGMPMIGADPIVDGPAEYLTAYFGSRADAVAWLNE